MAIKFASPFGGTLSGTSGDDVLWGAGGKDILKGLGGEDLLVGGSNNDELYGGGGSDILRGQGGNDKLFGQNGSDILKAGAGNDTLSGGSGEDFLDGGSGSDYFQFLSTDGTATDIVEDFKVGEDKLLLGGLQVFQDFREDFDGDGNDDTVLVLSNQAIVVLLDVSDDQNWSLGGGNVLLA